MKQRGARKRPEAASTAQLNRRRFLAGGLAPLLAAACRGPAPQRALTADLHVHLFGTGDAGSGCLLSDRIRGSMVYRSLSSFMAPAADESMDAAYVRRLVADASASGLDRVVLLGQDAAYDTDGRPDRERTHFLVPNDYVFDVCARHPELLVPCVSINPARRDAIAELERCSARGARLLKIHPPTQGVDIADRRHEAFFVRCRELEVVVMVHTGHEHSAPVVDIGLADPRRLEPALQVGCTVIACHAGTGWPIDRPDMLPHFLDLVRRFDRLWADSSILCSSFRRRDLLRLREAGADRILLHGSDYPFPSTPLDFAPEIGWKRARQLQGEKNRMRRDHELKTALGLGPSLTRAGALVDGDMPRR